MWVKSSFDNCMPPPSKPDSNTNRACRKTRGRCGSSAKSQSATSATASGNKSRDNDLWVSRHAPESLEQLAVHPAKVAEVQAWLQRTSQALLQRQTQRAESHLSATSCVLVLSGPAGCGKSQCVRTLATQLGYSTLLQWSEPVTDRWRHRNYQFQHHSLDGAAAHTVDTMSYGGGGNYDEWQTDSRTPARRFIDFVRRACSYSTVANMCEGDGDGGGGGGGAASAVESVTASATSSSGGLTSSSSSSSSSSTSSSGSLVLVDEIPGAVVTDKQQLYSLLRYCSRRSVCPCVFVVSDSGALGGAGGDYSSHALFPDSVCRELHIDRITFRPLTNRQIDRALQRIIQLERSNIVCVPDRDQLNMLVTAAEGDVRTAINNLQFLCAHSTASVQSVAPRAAKRPRKNSAAAHKSRVAKSSGGGQSGGGGESERVAVGARDSHMGLFRAIGKILYAKRQVESTASSASSAAAVNRLHHRLHYRPPLTEPLAPELICAQAGVAPDTLLTHLQHNVPHFITTTPATATPATTDQSLSLLADALHYLSTADLLSCAEWQSGGSDWCLTDTPAGRRSSRSSSGASVAVSVASRGVMFCRTGAVNLGFRQFTQPAISGLLSRQQARLGEIACSLTAAGCQHTLRQLTAELLPHLDLMLVSASPTSTTTTTTSGRPHRSAADSRHQLSLSAEPRPVSDYLQIYTCSPLFASAQQAMDCSQNSDSEDFHIEEYDD